MKKIEAIFDDLTFEELREWAGDKIYHRGEEYVDRVSQLSRTTEGAVAAWVAGTGDYATKISRDENGNLEAFCTCPYSEYGPCKHVVAVLLVAAEHIKKRRKIPLLDPEDELHIELMEGGGEDFAEEDYEEIDQLEKARHEAEQRLVSILSGRKREELQQLLVEVALEFPEVGRRIREADQLAKGNVGALVRGLRKEIRDLTSEDAWYNPWQSIGNLPDYDHVEQQLRALVDKGLGDEVLELGEELWRRGMEQVAVSDDEGETSRAISACMGVVLKALPHSRMTAPDQLLWLIDRELEDQYSMWPEEDDIFDDPGYTEQQWLEIVGVLSERLAQLPLPKKDSFSAIFKRQRLLDWLVTAYTRGGRRKEVIPLLEREVKICKNYEQLVDSLMVLGERDQARRWCIQGYQNTEQSEPGIAAALQKRLRLLAEEEERFDLACAYRAEDFFESPSENTYTELRQAAERVKLWPQVRKAVLTYLQTGQRPDREGGNTGDWPLGEIEIKVEPDRKRFWHSSYPDWDMLLQIALLELRLEDAVAIYRQAPPKVSWGWGIDEQLAEAVSASHPELCIQIWKSIADDLIDHVKPSAYNESAKYLRRIRTVYESSGRTGDWLELVKNLRSKHKRKRRLMEVLDRLEANQRLID